MIKSHMRYAPLHWRAASSPLYRATALSRYIKVKDPLTNMT
jgi:hypothetical protein